MSFCVVPGCSGIRQPFQAHCSKKCRQLDEDNQFANFNDLFEVAGYFGPPWPPGLYARDNSDGSSEASGDISDYYDGEYAKFVPGLGYCPEVTTSSCDNTDTCVIVIDSGTEFNTSVTNCGSKDKEFTLTSAGDHDVKTVSQRVNENAQQNRLSSNSNSMPILKNRVLTYSPAKKNSSYAAISRNENSKPPSTAAGTISKRPNVFTDAEAWLFSQKLSTKKPRQLTLFDSYQTEKR